MMLASAGLSVFTFSTFTVEDAPIYLLTLIIYYCFRCYDGMLCCKSALSYSRPAGWPTAESSHSSK